MIRSAENIPQRIKRYFAAYSLAGIPPEVIATTSTSPPGRKSSTACSFRRTGSGKRNSLHEISQEIVTESAGAPPKNSVNRENWAQIDRTHEGVASPFFSPSLALFFSRSENARGGREEREKGVLLRGSPAKTRSLLLACKTKAFPHEATFVTEGGWADENHDYYRDVPFLTLAVSFAFSFYEGAFGCQRDVSVATNAFYGDAC